MHDLSDAGAWTVQRTSLVRIQMHPHSPNKFSSRRTHNKINPLKNRGFYFMATPAGLLGINPSSSHLFGLPSASITLTLHERTSSHHATDTIKQKTPKKWTFLFYGDPGRIRTCGPQLRRLLLYPTELRGHILALYGFYPKCQDFFT